MDGEARIKAIRDLGTKPEAPLVYNLVIDDFTPQGIQAHAAVRYPSILLAATEGGKLIGGFAMKVENKIYMGTTMSNWWENKTTVPTRAGTAEQAIRGMRVSLHLMVQPELFSKFYGDPVLIQQGLIARCLVSMPESRIGFRKTRLPNARDAATVKVFTDRVTGFVMRDATMEEETHNVIQATAMSMTRRAKLRLISYSNLTELKCRPGCKYRNIKALGAKAAEHVARFAAILTFFGTGEYEIGLEAINNSITIVEWYLGEALRLMGGAEAMPFVDERAGKLLIWMVEQHDADGTQVFGWNILRNAPGCRSPTNRKAALEILLLDAAIAFIGGARWGDYQLRFLLETRRLG